MASACGSSSSGGDSAVGALQSTLQGAWTSGCEGFGGISQRRRTVISGLTATTTYTSWDANGTCTGTPTASDPPVVVTIAIGSSVKANLGATPVTAHQINGTSAGVTFYDLVYVDTTATPNRLYSGDSSGANDGSTPALRPTALDSIYDSRE